MSDHASAGHPNRDHPAIDFARTDEILQAFVNSPEGPLGLSYGMVRDGDLIHANGFGRISLTGSVPSSDSVFRIASVSKSFTAAAVLHLRDEGLLRLTDSVSDYLPLESAVKGRPQDKPVISILSCLTMSAGFPTDDPWADRQESMSRDAFDDMLRSGLHLVRAPDTAFEYSNLGYAILGRVIETVSGEPFQTYVDKNLLRPLGLASTTYDYRDVPDEKLVRGYRRREDDWVEQPFSAPGAFSSMGGLLSSVQDLTKWVGSMLDAFASDETAANGHPLSRAARREMQRSRRAVPPRIRFDHDSGVAELGSESYEWGLSSYGFGLFIESDPRWGEMVHHVGGYPGFSSHIRWHPSSGYGIVALTNSRYAPVWVPAAEALEAVLSDTRTPAKTMTLWPETSAARDRVEDIMRLDDATDIARNFEPPLGGSNQPRRAAMSPNICEDIPAAERAADILRIQTLVGKVRPDRILDVESQSPAHVVWWQEAASGYVRGELLLTPTRAPLIQTVALKAVPRPTGFLGQTVELLQAALAGGNWNWPEEIPTTDDVALTVYTQRLRDAQQLLGKCHLWWAVDAASPTSVDVMIVGERGRAVMLVRSNESCTAIEAFFIRPVPTSGTAHAVVGMPTMSTGANRPG